MLGRVLAISRLRVRIALHSMRSGSGLFNTIGAVLMALIGLALSIGMAVGFGVMTFFAARSADPGTLQVTYLVVFFACALFGLFMPLLFAASGEGLDLRRLLVFPLSRGQLFTISLGSAFLGTEHLFYYPGLLAITLTGILLPGRAVLGGLAIVAAFTVFVVVWSHAILLLLQGMMRRRRAREVVGILLFLVIILASLAPTLLAERAEGGTPDQRARLERALESAFAVGRLLPPAIAADGLRALHGGEVSGGLRSLGWLLAWILPGALAGHFVFTRHILGEGGSGRASVAARAGVAAGSTRRETGFDVTDLPVLSRGVLGMAAKELRYLLRSVVGKFNLLMTVVLVLIVVFIFAEALPEEAIFGVEPDTFALFGMLAYMTLLSNNFIHNAFAWEGSGFKLYLYGPLPLEEVLMGKNLGVWTFTAVCGLLAVLTWSVFKGIPDPLTLVSSLLTFACCVVGFTAVGNFNSILFPVPRDSSSMMNSPSGAAILLSLVTLVAFASLIGAVVFAPVALGYPALQPLVVAALLVGMLALYRRSLRWAARLMRGRAESIVESLRAAG